MGKTLIEPDGSMKTLSSAMEGGVFSALGAGLSDRPKMSLLRRPFDPSGVV